jgi:hypothetical protein
MQTEGFNAGRNLALEAMAAEAVLKRMAEQDESAQARVCVEIAPADGMAMRGLAAAVPLALLLWTMIGALLRVMAR